MSTGESTELELTDFEDNFVRLTINEAAASVAESLDADINIADILGGKNN